VQRSVSSDVLWIQQRRARKSRLQGSDLCLGNALGLLQLCCRNRFVRTAVTNHFLQVEINGKVGGHMEPQLLISVANIHIFVANTTNGSAKGARMSHNSKKSQASVQLQKDGYITDNDSS
jgi:hypothetical protein